MGKMEGFRSAPSGDCWHGESGGTGHTCVISLEKYLAFSGPELEAGAKTREAVSHGPSPGHLDQVMQRLWAKDLLSYVAWPLSISVFHIELLTYCNILGEF